MAKKSQHTIPASPPAIRNRVEGIYKEQIQPYEVILELQEKLFESNLYAKTNVQATKNLIIVCEHMPSYTLGKSGDEKNLLFKPTAVGATFHKISRGGDITFHGPGQMVVYPIFDLDTLSIGIADFVSALEDVIISLAAHYDITASRLEGAPGIWVDTENPKKICAIGMKVSRHCTMHGIALNVNTDLKYFDYIVPCGIPDKGVTSLKKELGREIDMNEVRDIFIALLEKHINIEVEF